MKKLIIIIAGCALLLEATTVFAAPNLNAITNQVAQKAGYDVKGTTATTISETVGRVIRFSLGFLGTIFLVLTIYAGVLRATAGGNEEQVGKSNNIFKMSIVGAVIIVSSYSITTLVFRYIVTPQTELQKIQEAGPLIGAQDNPGCCYFKPSYDQSREVCTRNTRTMCTDGTQITNELNIPIVGFVADVAKDVAVGTVETYGNISAGVGNAVSQGAGGGTMTNARFVEDCSPAEYNACNYGAVQVDLHPDDNNIWCDGADCDKAAENLNKVFNGVTWENN